MSGIDEQVRYPPMCPECDRTTEWSFGNSIWFLPMKAQQDRNLKYPLICFRDGGLDKRLFFNLGRVRCGFCSELYYAGTTVFNEIKEAYESWVNMPYLVRLSEQETSMEWVT